MADDITIKLTHDQALILFECLARFDEAKSPPVRDDEEQKVFWMIEGQLEPQLVEIVESDYAERVRAAKKRIADTKR